MQQGKNIHLISKAEKHPIDKLRSPDPKLENNYVAIITKFNLKSITCFLKFMQIQFLQGSDQTKDVLRKDNFVDFILIKKRF